MGLICTAITYAVLAAINIWCSRLLVEVKAYCDKHVCSLWSFSVCSPPSTLQEQLETTLRWLFIMYTLDLWCDFVVIGTQWLYHLPCALPNLCLGSTNCHHCMSSPHLIKWHDRSLSLISLVASLGLKLSSVLFPNERHCCGQPLPSFSCLFSLMTWNLSLPSRPLVFLLWSFPSPFCWSTVWSIINSPGNCPSCSLSLPLACYRRLAYLPSRWAITSPTFHST